MVFLRHASYDSERIYGSFKHTAANEVIVVPAEPSVLQSEEGQQRLSGLEPLHLTRRRQGPLLSAHAFLLVQLTLEAPWGLEAFVVSVFKKSSDIL